MLKASLITGLVRGCWHATLWFMEGLAPLLLIIYIILFLVAITSVSIFHGHIFAKHRNLLYCIIPHLLFNLLSNLTNLENGFVTYMVIAAILYAVAAVVTVVFAKRKRG